MMDFAVLSKFGTTFKTILLMNHKPNLLEIGYKCVEYMSLYGVKCNKKCNTKWLKGVYLCKCPHCHNIFVSINTIYCNFDYVVWLVCQNIIELELFKLWPNLTTLGLGTETQFHYATGRSRTGLERKIRFLISVPLNVLTEIFTFTFIHLAGAFIQSDFEISMAV